MKYGIRKKVLLIFTSLKHLMFKYFVGTKAKTDLVLTTPYSVTTVTCYPIAVLILDDDLMASGNDINFAFSIWQVGYSVCVPKTTPPRVSTPETT